MALLDIGRLWHTVFPVSLAELLDGASAATVFTVLSLGVVTLTLVALIAIGRQEKKPPLPPGPFNWPVVGSLFLVGPEPHVSMARLAERYGPLVYMRLGSRSTLVVSNAEMAREIYLVHDAEFGSRPPMIAGEYLNFDNNGLSFSPTSEQLKLRRKIINTELLSAHRIKDFRDVREEEAAAVVNKVWVSDGSGKTVDVLELTIGHTTNSMFRMVFGKQFDGSEEVLQFFKELESHLVDVVGRFNIGEYIPWLRWLDLQGLEKEFKKLGDSRKQVMQPIVEGHKRRRLEGSSYEKCFLDVLMSLEGEKRFSEAASLAVCADLTGAGTHTTATVAEWCLAYLIRYPHVQAKAHEELDRVVGKARRVEESDLQKLPYIEAIVKESQRMRPATLLGVPHYNSKEVVVAGYRVPANTQVFINQWTLMYDESTWKNPWEFRPERFIEQDIRPSGQDFRYLPFGTGRRGCPGIHLAMTTLPLSLATMLHAFEWRLPQGQAIEDMDFSQAFGLVAPMKKPLIAVATPRLPVNVYKTHL